MEEELAIRVLDARAKITAAENITRAYIPNT
jgi:hypothetical protein